MMEEKRILERGAAVLETPLIDIEFVDEDGKNILFDIADCFDPKHGDYLREIDGYIEPRKNNYDERLIRIATESLELGKKYYVKTSKPIEYRDSDEHLFTYGRTEDMQTLAISFPDPNDEFKWSDDFKKGHKLKWYDFVNEVKEGTKAVSFYLADREKEYIYMAVSWIWDIFEKMESYESAAEIFTWII